MEALKRMTPKQKFEAYVAAVDRPFSPVVEFDRQSDQVYRFDLTSNNTRLDEKTLSDTGAFSRWINQGLEQQASKYGIGGYNEHRTIYSRSSYFDGAEEPRRLHLGTDIWGPAGTPVYNFMEGKVHSFKFNDHFGDYGATIILQYQIQDLIFHALYGHLSLNSIAGLQIGQTITSGKEFATFGIPEENGYWPPHLHFQLILDMQGKVGDYPGVCQYSKADPYLQNCPDPYPILKDTFGTAAR
jgi:murein DD-endopeptidase MepM/ murein hydrolase activator NlpD